MKTNSLFKRLVSMLIVVLMICTLFPVTALADPAKPTYDDLKLLLKVKIDCDTESEEDEDEDIHDKITYGLLNNIEGLKPSFSVGEVEGNYCTVTVFSDRYIDEYNEDTKVIHRPEKNKDKNKSKTVTLKYENNKWELDDDDDDEIKFEVECNGIPTPEPAVTGITKEVVKDPTGLTGITYPTANNIATVPYGTTSVTLLYKVTVSGEAKAKYKVTDEGANCISNNASGTIPEGGNAVLYFTKTFRGLTTGDNTCSNTAAVKDTNFSATANVTVKVSAPEKPNDDTVKGLLANSTVTIDCVNTGVSHNSETYSLSSSTYTVSKPVLSNGQYICTVTIDSTDYITAYNTSTKATHSLVEDEPASKTITLAYDGEKWAVSGDASVTFNVKCGDTSDPINWETGLSVQKVATNTTSGTVVNTVAPGEEITYTITVKNETGKDLTDIEVSEVLNSNLTLKSISPENANYENGVWTISSLGNGDTATLTINVKVKDEVPDKTEIKNIATIIAATAGNDSLPGGIIPTGSSDVKVSAPAPQVPVVICVYRNGDTTTPYSTKTLNVNRGSTFKVDDLDINDYYSSSNGFEFEGWYNDGGWNYYKAGNKDNKLPDEITVSGWTNIYCMVTDYENVVVKAVTDDDKVNAETIFTGKALHGSNLIDFLNSDVSVSEKTGYTLDKWFNWDWYGHKFDNTSVVNGWTNVYVTYTSKPYTVIAKLYIDGEPAYYQATDFYTTSITGKYGETINYKAIKDWAEAKAKELKAGSSATIFEATIYKDGGTFAPEETFGQFNPDIFTTYVWVDVTTKANTKPLDPVVYYYEVRHLQEQLDGSFKLVDTDRAFAQKGTEVTAVLKDYPNYTPAPAVSGTVIEVTVNNDGTPNYLILEQKYYLNTYSVTYTDGVGGKVFKDDVHTVKSGATTPAFVGGIPTRPGYVFAGWTPTVSKTVKGNATYTAIWRKVKDTTVIEIGGDNSSSSSSKEENPNTGAPVFVGVSVGALAAAK